MLIGGWQKTTLIDFPGRVASTVFTVGCNFRCPFCHNPELNSIKNYELRITKQKLNLIREQEILDYLEKKRGIIDGVCITGGEPTMQKDLVEFCRKVKGLGLEIKLDTNGSNPEMIESLTREKLLDYVAIDFKTRLVDYPKVTKLRIKNYELRIKKTLKILKKSGIDFELRTTVVPGMHDEKIIGEMAEEIREVTDGPAAAKASAGKVVWYLQNFRGGKCLDESYNEKRSFTEKELNKLKVKAEGIIRGVKVRES